MIVQTSNLALDLPWRFAIVARGEEVELEKAIEAADEFYEIDGEQVRCMRTFHEEVAADLFFASHYNCDPHAPLTHLDAPVDGEQVVICWRQSHHMLENEPEDWEAVLYMFRAAMVTLHPQGTYLRLILYEECPAHLIQTLQRALDTSEQRAGVGFDYDSGESQLDILRESKSRSYIG